MWTVPPPTHVAIHPSFERSARPPFFESMCGSSAGYGTHMSRREMRTSSWMKSSSLYRLPFSRTTTRRPLSARVQATGAPPAPLPITQTSKSGTVSPAAVLVGHGRQIAETGRRIFVLGIRDAATNRQLIDRQAAALGLVALALGRRVARDDDREVVVGADVRVRRSTGLVLEQQERLAAAGQARRNSRVEHGRLD